MGNCRFDEDGLTAVLDDVRKHYAGENRAFLTGWEAGGHVVWAQVFHHPEHWRAVAIVSPNFQARCMDDGLVSSDTARRTLPVTVFHGDSGDYWVPGLYAGGRARARARARAAAGRQAAAVARGSLMDSPIFTRFG